MLRQTAPETCPFQGALELLGRRHALSILWILQQRSPRRFTEIRRATAMNPVTLSQRLSEMEKANLLHRTAHNEVPPRVDYDLTAKGRDLLVILDDLSRWSRKHRVG